MYAVVNREESRVEWKAVLKTNMSILLGKVRVNKELVTREHFPIIIRDIHPTLEDKYDK